MSAVTPACAQAHLAKSEHHSSFWFSTRCVASGPQPSAFGEKAASSVLNGSQSTPSKLVSAGVVARPT